MKKKFVIYESFSGKTVGHTVMAANKVEALNVFVSVSKIFIFDVDESNCESKQTPKLGTITK